MTVEEKKKLSVMLKRIQGQVGGIERMVGEDKSCEAVVTQITAAMSSLKSVAKQLLTDAVQSCSKEEYAKLLKRFLWGIIYIDPRFREDDEYVSY